MKKVYESIKGVLSEKHSREDLEKEAQRLSKVHNVPYDVVRHVINKETGGTWKTDQVNKDSGATGIMQILPKYATNTPAGYEVDKKDLLDPYKSMNAGVKKLGQWYNTHRNKKLPEDQLDVAAAKKAMASYNAGPNGGIEKDKQGKVKYVGAATYIKTGNPKHLPLEAQNYIKDFKVDTTIASGKSDKPFKRDASAMKAQIDPDQHKAAVPTVKVEPKAEPRPAVASTENPYTPGSYEHAFKQARIEGKPDFVHNGKRIAVKLKDTSESTNKMKKVYEAAKHVLAEKSLKPEEGIVPGYKPPEQDWFAGARRLFSGEANPMSKKKDADQEIASAHVNIEKSQAEKAAARDAARRESEKKGPSKEALAAISPVPVVKKAAQAPEVKKAAPAKKELSPFEKAFAAARDKGEKEFTWHTKSGRAYQVATKYKTEVTPSEPKADAKPAVKVYTPVTRSSTRSISSISKPDSTAISPEEMNDIDKQKETARVSPVGKADRRAEVIDTLVKQANGPASTPAKKTDDELKSDELWKDIRKEIENETPEEKAARDARVKKYKEEMNIKTNEETQMSINKKFNVSDSLYSAVMEVMKKPSQGSTPRNEKEKDLAAMSPPGHLITHGDVLKARGVKMKEDTDVVDESLASSIEKLGKAVGLFKDDEPTLAPKKDEKKSMDQPNQNKVDVKPNQPKKDKTVKEDWVDSKGKFHKEAPPPGQVPSPDEGYRPPPKKKAQPGSTTKAMEENTDTPGNSYEHQCAIHVKSESFGEGRTITTQHADPDQDGNIAWYDVMFEHGIERYVPTAELEILVSESHMHSMKKKKK
jgi:Transglycosylase SLT domain